MLGLGVTLEDDRLVINGLSAAAVQMPNAINRGLSRVGKGGHRSAFELLSGAGAGKDLADLIRFAARARSGDPALVRVLVFFCSGMTAAPRDRDPHVIPSIYPRGKRP